MNEIPEKLTTALADRYRIERELGAGGMATVYLADDLKHDRKVAIKVLRPELAAVVGAERFLAEIKTTANLQHPNILPLFDSGEADSFLFYVMPYVEGESLRDRLDREKQLRVEDAVTLTRKIADALDYAHEKGVVHRDIKPANILLSGRGEPLVADFGIALAVSQAGGGRITETGLSLGTPHYMSPEQATGDRDVDPRSDIYALGCVLYELLAGQPPFAAPTAQAVLARILTEQPRRVTELRRTVPPHIASVLARALEKLPADRFESAQELLEALDDPQFTYETEMVTAPMVPATRLPAATEASRPRAALVPILAAGLVVAVVGAAVGWLRSPPEAAPAPTTRVVLADLPTDAPLGSGERLAISRDGSKLAAISYDEGVRRLYWREVDQFGRTAIPNSEGAGDPHFSPDGEWLVFDRDDQIYRAELPSGEIFPVTRGRNPHWGTEDMMIFLDGGDLYRVPPMGGDPTLLLEPDLEVVPGGIDRPFLLPDGSGVLFQAGQSDPDTGDRMVFVLDIESGEVADLGLRGANPRYLASGHVVVGRQSQALVAARFDLETLRVVGSPSTVLTGVTVYGGGATQFAASDNGTVFYELGGSTASGRDVLVVEDLEGNRTPTAIGDGRYGDPRWSPDGTSIVYYAVDASGGLPNIFTYNVDLRQAPRQITFEGVNLLPVWSPDGSSVAFIRDAANTDGYDILVKNLNDTEPPRTLVSLPGDQWPMDWPSDDVLLFASYDDGTSVEALRVTDPTAGDGAASTLYFDSQFELFEARVSPTGDLVAYVSDESGADEVYLRSFPQAGQPERISVDGGRRPQWSADGNTVYFMRLAATGTPSLDLAAADIRRGPPFAVMQRRTVTTSLPVTGDLDLHPQADRLIIETDTEMSVSEEESEPVRAVLVTNWFTELERLTGGAR